MKIDILCGEGSQNGVHLSDLHGVNNRVGVGGSEYALLTMAEAWSKRGDEVTLYNNPERSDGVFEQRAVKDFDKTADRDVLIVFRAPTQKISNANGLRVFWSCDQYTVGDFRLTAEFAHKTVTISPYHTKYFVEKYEIRGAFHIDLPVRTWEYKQGVEKVKNRLIFTSVPDRGLDAVFKTFTRIKKAIPDTSLVITSDYRLWGTPSPGNAKHTLKFLHESDVEFIGAVPRERLVQEQLKAQIHLYPFTGETEELFCVAIAESQVAGVLPISSGDGALGTTNMGVVIDGNARDGRVQDAFVEKTVEYLQSPDLLTHQKEVQRKALERFDINNILKQWDKKVFDAS